MTVLIAAVAVSAVGASDWRFILRASCVFRAAVATPSDPHAGLHPALGVAPRKRGAWTVTATTAGKGAESAATATVIRFRIDAAADGAISMAV